ncbi:MAG: hypothetical protein JSV88_03630 [Candidatus Aminicenantes bacterium]|nr:MAG: hypothetical protein JSV88_03630 [Candidatus Aminicenantes bacterium]
MKRNFFLKLTMLSVPLALFLLISNCEKLQKTGDADMEIAKKLVQTLNELPGLTFEVETTNMTTEPSGKGRYLIILKDPAIAVDISGLNIGLPVKDTKIPVKTKEVVFQYGPKEKYLALVSSKDISFDWDFSGSMEIPGKAKEKPGLPAAALKLSMEEVTFKNYDISPLLDTKTNDLMELAVQLLGKNQSFESVVKNFTYEFGFLSKEKKKIAFLMEIEKLESYQRALSEVFISLYRKGSESPDFSNILKQGKALLDLEMKCSLFKVSAKEDEKLSGGGIIDDVSFSYFLKPDKTKSFFIYGFNWDMKDMKLSIPGNKEIELAGRIKEWGMKFSLENLSAAFVQAYFDLVKKSLALSASMDKEKFRQQQMVMGLTIVSEFMKSKPIIKCSISPFKHDLGELDAQFNFQFFNLMTPPVGKAAVKIPKLEDMLTKIKGEKLLSPKTAESLLKIIKKYVITDENGNGIVTLETKPDQPGIFFLNGKPIK